MARPMGRILGFASEDSEGTGAVHAAASRLHELGRDVWWIQRDGSDCPHPPTLEPKEMHRATFDWHDLLNGARWLLTGGKSVLGDEEEFASWSAALTFAELEGTLNAFILDTPSTRFTDVWSVVVPRIRQLHILLLDGEQIDGIARLEKWPIDSSKDGRVATLERIHRQTLVPHVIGRDIKQGWAADAHTYGVAEASSGESSTGTWLGLVMDGLIQSGHVKGAAQEALDSASIS
ncbi:MAG: hypothetical protein ACJZ59_01605 [Candidatus Thalassarchaeaceae archaeon]